jgi:hypothetical protein
MPRGATAATYEEMKGHLSAPARRVIEELIDDRRLPSEVLCRLVREEGCSDEEAYGYVREVLYRSTMELTGAEARLPLRLQGQQDRKI